MLIQKYKNCFLVGLVLAISMLSIKLSGGWCPGGGGSRGGGTDPSVAAAVSAVSTCLKIGWEERVFYNDSESKELEEAIKKFAKKLQKDKPVLLFFGSSKTEPMKKNSSKTPPLTKQAKKSNELADSFNDKTFKVQVALKFFDCYDIDVSDISEEESPEICHENAPILAIYNDGEVFKTVTSASTSRLYGVLSLFLKQNGYDLNALNKKVNKPLRSFYDTERKLYFKKTEYDRITADFQKKPKKSKEKRVEKINKEYQKIVSDRDTHKNELNTILTSFIEENTGH